MRPLTLHVSALSDAEYNLYTASLDDLSVSSDTDPAAVHDDAHYERMSVGVREARAWIRGRYSDLPASDIDAILKLFHPNMLPSDSLTGGQFFAALRLVVHAESGKGVDRTLAFVQGEFTSLSTTVNRHRPCRAIFPIGVSFTYHEFRIAHFNATKVLDVPRPPSPPKRPVQAPPCHPDRPRPSTSSSSSPESNPFTRKSMEQPVAPPPSDSETPAVIPHRHSQKISHNPFLMRDKADSAEGTGKSPDKAAAPKSGKIPPLPPRKPAPLSAPPRRASEAVPTISSTTNLALPFGPPLVPVKPNHITSPLMRQSLEASKQGQTMKRAEEQLDRERVLQVLKTTSSSSSGSSRTRSLSPTKQGPKLYFGSGSEDTTSSIPPLPRRRKPSSPSSVSSSLPSLDQVATATLKPLSPPSTTASPFRPPLPSRDSLTISTSSPMMSSSTDGIPSVAGPGPSPMPAPPMHPDRRPSTDPNDSQSSSPTSPRVMRSKSMHHPGAPPLPPPRRRRPESVQLTPTSSTTELPTFPPLASSHAHARTSSFQGLSRHLSLTRDRDTADSPMSNIQKTISNLHLKAQPRLEAARYKAEAGFTRRGYVNHAQLGGYRWREEGEEGLMSDTRWAAANVDRDPYYGPTTDDEPSSGDERGGRVKGGGGGSRYRDQEFLVEADNLKWPAGEGWKPL
ncbi:hypothetical protein HYDPIDRAFT_176112 [Hydnomerulius pinastri MD-312]|uniref:Uncharacterized protein n=1 Tax=Hydnomerulius pinastri MD-312 TaxID=994086 RepID=A0A0C9VBF6_9AGAM|nr:hypothetical protein HYDPIDRAFT_176112 [Hydnomerulius pinastri MD-312]